MQGDAETRRARRWRGLALAAAVIITAYGGLLRVEALIANYGPSGQPGWSAAIERHLSPVARRLRPARVVWGPISHPYVNGDPINYIKFAREMRRFYQAHVREPVFLALTRCYLGLTGGRDIAVSYASATGSTLAVFATYLLGAAAFSRPVGLGAAFALAIEFQAIAQGIEGWRDDTFMFFVTLSAWAMLRVRQMPTHRRAVAAGIACAGAALTRITALSFIVPGFLWLVLDGPREQRVIVARRAVTAVFVAGVVIAPYLIACAIETGDPFLSINYHTRFYRAAEGLPYDQPQSALAYVAARFRSHPVGGFDTAFQGLITFPFFNKWSGFGWWSPWLTTVLECAAAVGAAAAVWSPNGRFVLVLIVTSLIPYAMTWSLRGGSEWRFTQHVYPLYLVLACWPIAFAARWAVTFRGSASDWRRTFSRQAWLRPAIVSVGVVGGWILYEGLPVLTAREAMSKGEPVTIAAGERDRYFFDGAWSPPVEDGIVVRIAESDRVRMRLPTPEGSDYLLTIRADPAETRNPLDQPWVTAFLNGRAIMQLRMTRDPSRIGAYRVRVPKDAVRSSSRLDFVASRTVRAGDAGPRFSALPPDTPVSFRLWYVRLEPVPAGSEPLK